MDFKFTEEQEALRRKFFDVCRELEKKQPTTWTDMTESTFMSDEGYNYHLYCAKEFVKRKWLTRHWPCEYGGEGAPFMEQAFFAEARGYYRTPGVDPLGDRKSVV